MAGARDAIEHGMLDDYIERRVRDGSVVKKTAPKSKAPELREDRESNKAEACAPALYYGPFLYGGWVFSRLKPLWAARIQPDRSSSSHKLGVRRSPRDGAAASFCYAGGF